MYDVLEVIATRVTIVWSVFPVNDGLLFNAHETIVFCCWTVIGDNCWNIGCCLIWNKQLTTVALDNIVEFNVKLYVLLAFANVVAGGFPNFIEYISIHTQMISVIGWWDSCWTTYQNKRMVVLHLKCWVMNSMSLYEAPLAHPIELWSMVVVCWSHMWTYCLKMWLMMILQCTHIHNLFHCLVTHWNWL